MLNPHPRPGILPVDSLLLLAELFPSHTALDDAVLHLVFAHHAFHALPDICAVGMRFLPPVVIVYQQLGRNGVVLFSTRGHRLLYQLAPGVDFRMVLVAVIFLAALLRPTGVLSPLARPRKPLKLVRSTIWYSACSSLRLYMRCRTRILNIST